MRTRIAVLVAIASALALVPSALAVPRHTHTLTTPNGESHVIARGVTFHAPCEAFLNFHEIVHTTVFGTPATGVQKNPNGPLVPGFAPGAC
jgi:hypothetical protein